MARLRLAARKILPPILADSLRALTQRHRPGVRTWHQVGAGLLRGCWLEVDPADSWAQKMLDSSYEPAVASALASLVQPGWVCLDVGAHVGYYSMVMARLTGPAGHVHAFEPHPNNQKVVVRHLERNALTSVVHLHSIALGNADGKRVFRGTKGPDKSMEGYVEGMRNLTLPGMQKFYEDFVEHIVEQRRLDGTVDRGEVPSPNLLKIDVEGAEVAVLEGTRDTLQSSRPIVLAELHTAATAVQCVNILKDCGYSVRVLNDPVGRACKVLAR